MLGAFKDIHDGDCYSVSNSTISNEFGLGSIENSPKRISEENFFEPNFVQENPFASNLTLNLMRNTSTEFPFGQLLGAEITSSSSHERDTLFNAFEGFNSPDLTCNRQNSSHQHSESCTGKFAPVENDELLQFDLKHQKIERKRIQRAPRQQPKRKSRIKTSLISLKTDLNLSS